MVHKALALELCGTRLASEAELQLEDLSSAQRVCFLQGHDGDGFELARIDDAPEKPSEVYEFGALAGALCIRMGVS